MRTIRKLTDNRFINIKEIKDPENNVNGYQFAERLGVDSVAFVCYDPKIDKFLVNKEYKPPVNSFIVGAFGGSMDKDKSPKQIVKDEVKEEAGFVVGEEDIYKVGKVLVSTQMNQFCHLFVVFVDKDDQGEREPENKIEAMAGTKWMDAEDVCNLDDWKAPTIIVKAQIENIVWSKICAKR